MITRMLGERVALELDLAPALPRLMADSAQMDQLLMNLLVNARDAMPEGGVITLRTRLVRLEPGEVRAQRPEEAGQDFILLSVKDSGTGMNKAVREHIFEPFFTTKERGKGTGLGLSTVYGAAKQHNGWVTVESEPGRGAEFSVYLPYKPCGLPGGPAACPDQKRENRIIAAKILIIEDDAVLRGLSVKALTAHGHSPEKAASIEEALTILKERGGGFDVIFTDMVLGDGKIMTVVDELARLSPNAGFIFTSGYLEEKENWDFMNRMEYKFIPKPYSVDTLLENIDDTLGK
jgi:two-component system cell cycle sensor histidine kinase/response regulator CckA